MRTSFEWRQVEHTTRLAADGADFSIDSSSALHTPCTHRALVALVAMLRRGYQRCGEASEQPPANSATSLPTATLADTFQVGIRAHERAVPAESPSHAVKRSGIETQVYSLTVAGAASDWPSLASPTSRFTHRPYDRWTPERATSLLANNLMVNVGLEVGRLTMQ